MQQGSSGGVGVLARLDLGSVLLPSEAHWDRAADERGGGRRDLQDARVLAQVGSAGLLTLPVLMVASVVVQAPLAGPAAIALGYLATARALATADHRRAAMWGAAVFAAFVLWVVVVFGFVERPLSPAGMFAALLVCGFAAGPALLQHWRKLAGTGLPPARKDSGPGIRQAPVSAPALREDVSRTAEPSGADPTSVSHTTREGEEAPAYGGIRRASCDVREAIAFALRHAGPKAADKRITLVSECTPDLLAGCEQQTCRRILHGLTEAAVARSRNGDTVRILGKSVRGAVLLRVTACRDDVVPHGEAGRSHLPSPDLLRQTVEAAGGTILFELFGGLERASVRLPDSKHGLVA